MNDIFVSYAAADRSRVEPLVLALEHLGWSVWWDWKILPGHTWDKSIEKALKEARCVIVVWTCESIGSEWVIAEASVGRKRKNLVPVLLDEVEIPLEFSRIQAAQLVGWTGEVTIPHFDQLVRSISAIVPKPVTAAAAATRKPTVEPVLKIELSHVMTRVNAKDGQTYVWIPPGTFTMGCSKGDNEASKWEKPAHAVTLTRGFWMGQTPVTVGAYARFQGEEPVGNAELPQVYVSWEDAKAYSEWAGMRLPTEAEWEYAARAGTTVRRYGALDAVAWYGDNSGSERLDTRALWAADQSGYYVKLEANGNSTHPVRGKQPNAWGLYDMLGNVWEWVEDWDSFYGKEAVTDPTGPADGGKKVIRGGAWDEYSPCVRASTRNIREPGVRARIIGFRCAGELQ